MIESEQRMGILPLDDETVGHLLTSISSQAQSEARQHPHVVFPPAFAPQLARRIDGEERAAQVAADAYDIANHLYGVAEQYAMIGLGATANDPGLRDYFNRIRPFKALFAHPKRFQWTLGNVAEELRKHAARLQRKG